MDLQAAYIRDKRFTEPNRYMEGGRVALIRNVEGCSRSIDLSI